MKTTEENNRMIAEFMGAKLSSVPNLINMPQTIGEERILCVKGSEGLPSGTYKIVRINELRYHSSWDWLMPVVEKIEWGLNNGENFWIKVSKIDGENSYIPYVYYARYDNGKPFDIILHKYFDSKLGATYQAVVSFIEWYNEQEKL